MCTLQKKKGTAPVRACGSLFLRVYSDGMKMLNQSPGCSTKKE